MTDRLPEWRERLQVYLQSIAHEPLEFGRHDCALFAADAVRAMTGVDLAEAYRGRYTTLHGGMRILARDGFSDQVALVAAHLAPVTVAMAMPGDLAVFETQSGRALGVVQGAAVYVLHVDGLLGLVPLTDATEAFTV